MLILNNKLSYSLFPFKWLRMAGFAVPFALFALGGPVAGLAQDATEEMEPGLFKFTTGFDYTSGDYGDVQETDIWYVPFIFQYEWAQRVIAKLTVPYIRITGPGGVVGGGDDVTVITTTQAAQRQTESGLGDVVGGLSYVIDPFAPAAPYFEVTGKVKFPTADEDDRLGTGEFDYTIQLDSYKSFGPITPAVTAGRKFKGSPEGFELNDVWFTSVGGIYKFNDAYSGGVFYDWQEPTSEQSNDVQELFGYLRWKLDNHWSFTGYGIVGFSDGSPDEGTGLQIAYRM